MPDPTAMPDAPILKQVRKALNDIDATMGSLTSKTVSPYNKSYEINHLAQKAHYQLFLLRKMIDEQPSRRQPWSYYQPQVKEEFE